MFDAALFDMDGLLLDSERVHRRAWTAAAATEGLAIPDEVYSTVIGRAAQDAHRLFVDMMGGPATYERLREIVQADLHRDGKPPVFPLKPGVGELLAALRARRVRCAVASSTRADEIRRRLDAVGVLAHFDAVAGGDEVVRGKPDPAIYHLAAGRLGVSASACIAFEDSENGARAALAAGTALIVVPDLRRPPPDVLDRSLHVFDSLHEAHPHLPRWFPAARGDRPPQPG